MRMGILLIAIAFTGCASRAALTECQARRAGLTRGHIEMVEELDRCVERLADCAGMNLHPL